MVRHARTSLAAARCGGRSLQSSGSVERQRGRGRALTDSGARALAVTGGGAECERGGGRGTPARAAATRACSAIISRRRRGRRAASPADGGLSRPAGTGATAPDCDAREKGSTALIFL